MKTKQAFITHEGIVVPERAMLRLERDSGYGSVPGLDDAELADPAELERQVFLAEWGPILSLPCRGFNGSIRPARDELGHVEGAFGTWDFERLRGPFDKARYKADKLQEQLRNDLFMLDVVRERVSPQARGRVRQVVLSDQADVDDIDDYNEGAYARWLRRIRCRSAEIRELRQFSRQRRLNSASAEM
jgi:hypothetical protein